MASLNSVEGETPRVEEQIPMAVYFPRIRQLVRNSAPMVFLTAVSAIAPGPLRATQPLPTYKVHVFDPRTLFRDSETPEELNPSAVKEMRERIRNVDPKNTQFGTMPTWVFPPFSHAALEPNFSPHRDITGVDVPQSLLQCIPSLDQPEYRRLIGIRNRLWATLVREFTEIDNWLIGMEDGLNRRGVNSPLIDCKGNKLGDTDLIEFIVDTLEELYPTIKQESPCAKVIAFFTAGPLDIEPYIDIPHLIQEEIQNRGRVATEYYDVFADQLAPSFEGFPWAGVLLDRFPDGRCTLDFAHFGNGSSIRSDLVLMNATATATRPSVYFFDQDGDPLSPESLVDVVGDLEVRKDGALTFRTDLAPLGEVTISTHGRGALVTGSVRVVSTRPIGGALRFSVPDVGVSGVGISPPVDAALYPVRRQAGGIRTAAAIHNLSTKAIAVTCRLMKEGAVLEEVEFPVEANGQAAWFIEELFPVTDTSDFAGSVRCAVPWRELFTGVAVEMDSKNRIFTTLPLIPVLR